MLPTDNERRGDWAEGQGNKDTYVALSQYLEMCRTTHGSMAQCKVKGTKLYTVANTIPKLNTKLAEAQETFGRLCDGRTHREEMISNSLL